jgi:ABC-type bacteriocin/lantibiotic exporter with double-glycine peptidase domain
MPLPKPPHIQQTTLGYCLPACAQMALAQVGLNTTQAELAKTLGTRAGIGTSFSSLRRLSQPSIKVEVAEWATIEALAADTAVIAAVTTSPGLPGWGDIRTQHTVLVVGLGLDQVTYHDPALADGPASAPRGEFLLAWSEMAELTAFLRKDEG